MNAKCSWLWCLAAMFGLMVSFAPAHAQFKTLGKMKTIGEPAASELVGTTWVGKESLAGFNALKFQFQAGGKAVMTDAQETVAGTWSHSGASVTLRFYGSVTYRGTLKGATLSGNAENGVDRWTWSVTRQGAAAAPVAPKGPQIVNNAPATKGNDRVKDLIETLKNGSSNDRTAAANELSKLGNDATPAVPWLSKIVGMKGPTNVEIFTKGIDPSRVAAARAINKIQPEMLRSALEEAQQSVNLFVRAWAVKSLNNLNGASSTPPQSEPKRFKELAPLKTR